MDIDLICFGIAKDIIGGTKVKFNLAAPYNVEHLKSALVKQYPKLQSITAFQIAVNETYAENTTVINVNDEVVVIPPVSGG